MRTIRDDMAQPLGDVERAWLRRLGVVAVFVLGVPIVMLFRAAEAFCECTTDLVQNYW